MTLICCQYVFPGYAQSKNIYSIFNPESGNNKFIQANRLSPPCIMVHYMPWFQSPEVRGYWGGHWTMSNCDPDSILMNDQRQIAAHYYPLTGPYDSSDPNILEYHVLLMKLSGIEGVIVDWGGNEEYYDYGLINESTNELFNFIKKAQLKFSICYEDATIGNMVNDNHISEQYAHNYGQGVMLYMQEQWFNDESYLKINNRPVLLNFGPQYFFENSDWDTLFSVLDPLPLFFPLNEGMAPAVAGSYPWPPMWSSVNDVLSMETMNDYLANFYSQSVTWDHLVAGVWPGFKDYYFEGGYGFTYGFLDAQDGLIFELTLQSAINANPDVIQIVTWNDFGEGTIIEPTVEFGYTYLEKIQTFRKVYIDSSFSFQPADLELPLKIFNLRKTYKDSTTVNTLLDQAFDFIVAGDLNNAKIIIDAITTETGIKEYQGNFPGEFSLSQNYPNPFNLCTTIEFTLPVSGEVNLSIYNIQGQIVKNLVNEFKTNGIYKVKWDGTNNFNKQVASGQYVYRLKAGEFISIKKMTLIK